MKTLDTFPFQNILQKKVMTNINSYTNKHEIAS